VQATSLAKEYASVFDLEKIIGACIVGLIAGIMADIVGSFFRVPSGLAFIAFIVWLVVSVVFYFFARQRSENSNKSSDSN
jgi:membrane protein implicated in regulation of membrane protease activity